MTEAQPVADNRLERRKMRTRAALIRAAQGFIAAGKLNVPVLEITQTADVGMGSFYNHFDSKEELFQAAVNEVRDTVSPRAPAGSPWTIRCSRCRWYAVR